MCAGDIFAPPSSLVNSFEPLLEPEPLKYDREDISTLVSLTKTEACLDEPSSTENQSQLHILNNSHLVNNVKTCVSSVKVKKKEISYIEGNVPTLSLFSLKKCYFQNSKTLLQKNAKRTRHNLCNIFLHDFYKNVARNTRFKKRRNVKKRFNKRGDPKSSLRSKKHKGSFRIKTIRTRKMENKSFRESFNENSLFTSYKMNSNLFRNKRGFNKYQRVLTCSLNRFRKSRKCIKERFKKNSYNIYPLDSEQGFHSSRESKGRGFSFSENSALKSSKNSSPEICKSLAKPPVLESELTAVQQGAIPRFSFHSEEYVSKKGNEINGRHTSRRSSSNTIKLIDKLLEAPSESSTKNTKTRAPLLKGKTRSKSLCMEDSTSFSDICLRTTTTMEKSTRSPVNLLNNNAFSDIQVKRPKSLDKFSTSFICDDKTIDQKSLSFSNLGETGNKKSVKDSSLQLFDSNSLNCKEGVTASFESINTKTSKTTLGKDKRQTSDLLQRLDNVLSELVEEEKLKIQTCEMLGISEDKKYCKSMSSQKLKIKKKTKDNKLSSLNVHPVYLAPPDILSRYKEKFTDFRPRNPRILKSDSRSKLLTMTCYQRPRPKKNSSEDSNKSNDSILAKSDKEINQTTKKSKTDCQSSAINSKHKYSIDEELTYTSFTSGESEKDFLNPKNSCVEDEDDTCYGSDNVISDLTVEKDENLFETPLNKISKHPGDCSIDSAYTESREATPDIKIIDVNSVIHSTEKGSYGPLVHEDPFAKSTSIVKVINDAKKYLLDKIKDTQSYSDNNINKILHYYSRKWTHIPEREMKIIIRSIRNDLGVRAPPKECIEFLMEENISSDIKGSSCENLGNSSILSVSLRKELSKEDILLDLTETLPEYLKAYQEKRKTSSLSPSPEPSKFNFQKGLSESMPRFPGRNQDPLNKNDDIFGPSSSFVDLKISVPPIEISETDRPTGESDEDWVKKFVGEETFREMKMIINELKEKESKSETDPKDFEKMASELCEKFSISF